MSIKEQQPQPGAGIKLEDVYFILFRHKWKIIIFSAIGLVAASVLFFTRTPLYQSEAKLLLRYVLERKSLGPMGSDAQIQSPDTQGENIINSELEILNSFDLAVQVAEAVGVEKILGKNGGESNRIAAALVIRKGLIIDVPKKTSVIRLIFQHPNPALVQPVLENLMEAYLKKHLEVHRAVGLADEFLTQQTEQLRFRLSKIEDDLWSLRTNSGSISAEDLKIFSERRGIIQQNLSAAQAQLEEKKALLRDMEKFLPSKMVATNLDSDLPVEKVNDYKSICAQLSSVRTNVAALLTKFTDENPIVQRTQENAADLERRKAKLETEFPKLTSLGLPTDGAPVQPGDLAGLTSEVRALEAKIKILQAQLAQVRAEELNIAKAQNAIAQLQRQKEVDEASYKYYVTSMEQARLDETLGPGKISNIKSVQDPSPPTKAPSKILKAVGGALAAGVLGGLGLAFAIELFFDKSLKRPGEIKSKLQLPVFVSVPYLNGKPRPLPFAKLLPWKKPPPRQAPPLSEGNPAHINPASTADGEISTPPWESQHRLFPYFEQLRDRLIILFESRNMTHKPKLVAVTSCSKGAGVSTLATGLAASLSETGEGKVLLIDMNSVQGATHPFYKGKPTFDLPDVLEGENREGALVQEKLYLVKGTDVAGEMARLLPKKLAELMPRIKASDYDYVIFDMPPVNETSVTARLAPYMDIMFLVLEAEKTHSLIAKNALAILSESKANVAPIFNKRRDYVPSWLHTEV